MMVSDDDFAGQVTPGADNSGSVAAASETSADAGGDIHSYIGARLRKVFDDVANQPVPDRFLQLMQELDRA